MSAVYKKELGAYFNTLPGYIFLSGYLLICGLFFASHNIANQKTDFMPVLTAVSYAMLLLTPILTMRLFAAERQCKTDRLLVTAPVSTRAIVAAKYLSALTVFVTALAASLIMPAILSVLGTPSWAEIMTGYLGLALFGAALLAVGVFVSSLMKKNVTALLSTLAVTLIILLFDEMLPNVGSPALVRTVMFKVAPLSHLWPFTQGFLSLSSIVYFISVTLLFLFLTVRMIEHRKWSKGRCK